MQKQLERYIETGLTPEEIIRMKEAYGDGLTLRKEVAERIEIIREIKTERLRELAEEERKRKR